MKRVPDFSSYYVSEDGFLYKGFGQDKKIMVSQHKRKDGYMQSSIYHDDGKRKNALIHRLVLSSYIPIEKYHEVNHKDGNKTNNDLSNLEWVTPSQNSIHAYIKGLKIAPKGITNGRSILKDYQVIQIRETFKNYPKTTIVELSKKYGVGETSISRIKNNISWKHLL